MSVEEKDLLARIGQLAGQINRHKSQHTAAPPSRPQTSHQRLSTIELARNPPANYSEDNNHFTGGRGRGRGAYLGPSYRIGKPQVSHRHRTLHLNQQAHASDSSPSSQGLNPGTASWVSRNDRHRQLINANVYEQKTQTRVKAIEETRQKKIQLRKIREKAQLDHFFRHRNIAGDVPANFDTTVSSNEIVIEGIRFHVAAGGKKLVKHAGDIHSATPKAVVVANVRFHRTKSGNLVVNRIVQDQRRSGPRRRSSLPCRAFSTTGNITLQRVGRTFSTIGKAPVPAPKAPPADISTTQIARPSARSSSKMATHRVPNCLHFAKGNCSKPDCPYTHSKAEPSAWVCKDFGWYGFCDEGADCAKRHVLFECPDFSNTGICKTRGCKLLHRERASLLRNKAKADVAMDEDVSSDEESHDSDDVDSDEVAEFIDADSDDSDFENQKDFIPL
ncbi:CCCH zinc finger protein [Moelleriella libera RCEF 2490]|uniref:CCCH zinc finger protein n=1 Tax=Moelleriella libera RCEF 2490 TaxID=1081109 RepID=A0A166UVR6_9HYPO|nr:CCCH zinc finger protein [Moelleriella libera RCEF 2490]